MGVRVLFFSVLVLWMCCFVIFSETGHVTAQKARNICEVRGCNCTVKAAPWKDVNCTLDSSQEMTIEPNFVPERVAEIFISGGRRITFHEKSFNHLEGLMLLRIDGVKNLMIEKQTFYDLTHPSLLVEMKNCDRLDIKTGAFENVQSSVDIEIANCGSVSVEKSAFNKLSKADFKTIPNLVLAAGTFEFKNQANVGMHGPVTSISFDNVKITKIPHQTFFSSLAEVKFQNSEIYEVQDKAFSCNEISSISIVSCNIRYLRRGAFIEKTLIYSFRISNCTINRIEAKAVMAAITNLTVQHSRITEIQSGAVNSTVASVEITGNEIAHFRSSGFVVQNWNRIYVEQNLIKYLHSNFIVSPANPNVEVFMFKANDIFNIEPGALSFVPDIEIKDLIFQGNFFNLTCHCSIDEWIEELITANASSKINLIMDSSFCTVTDLLSRCFELPVGVINIRNFTELVCNPDGSIVFCEPYNGETKIVNTTGTMFFENTNSDNSTWLTLIIAGTLIIALAAIFTLIIMFIRGGRWLKRKGYFRKIHYNQNEASNDEENTIETVDDSDKIDISEDLTMDLLQDLSKKLDDPDTHQEASEMIEQLYQKYIREGGYENNNQQEEEAHLYEELGNLAEQQNTNNRLQNDSRSILKIMEEKFNLQFDESGDERRPALAGEYSEPSDAAVHLYSELKQNREDKEESENKDSLRSRGSSNMAFRPLPDKPGTSKM